MEMRKGYWQSDIGVIPNDWRVSSISKVSNQIFLGLTSKVDYVEDNGIPLIRATDIASGKLKFDIARTISKKQHKELTKLREAKKNDILVSKSGSLGVCAIVDTDKEFSIYESIIVIKSGRELDPIFLLWLLRDKKTQDRMIGDKVGSTVGHLNLLMFRELLLQIPTPIEQTAIATALSDTDALITSLEKLIDKKRNIKQGAMQQLLTGKKRLPGFSGKWEVKKLGELANMSSGGTPQTNNSNYYNGIIPWVVIADMTKAGKYISATEKCISEEGLKNCSAKLFKKGSILFAMYASIGKCSITTLDITFNQAILGIQCVHIDTEFLYYYLSFNEQKFQSIGQTGTQSNLNKIIVKNFDIPYPTDEEQSAIAQVLSDMDTEIESLDRKLEKYKLIKQGMMQELLTGKTRLV